MVTLDERFALLVEAARDDLDVIGMALSGSRGIGTGTADSDYDAIMLLRDEVDGERRRHWKEQAGDNIELWVTTQGECARYAASWGSEFAWAVCWAERYGFAHAAVLVDKTGEL